MWEVIHRLFTVFWDDVSDDLMHWSPFNTDVLTNTVVDLVDTNAVSKSHRFYRLDGN